MLRSLYSGVSGVKAHQTYLDVVGNNVANVNTAGYKKSNIIFQDLLYQNTRGAMAPDVDGGRGGIDPMQVGLGVNVGAIETIHTQGQHPVHGEPERHGRLRGRLFRGAQRSGHLLHPGGSSHPGRFGEAGHVRFGVRVPGVPDGPGSSEPRRVHQGRNPGGHYHPVGPEDGGPGHLGGGVSVQLGWPGGGLPAHGGPGEQLYRHRHTGGTAVPRHHGRGGHRVVLPHPGHRGADPDPETDRRGRHQRPSPTGLRDPLRHGGEHLHRGLRQRHRGSVPHQSGGSGGRMDPEPEAADGLPDRHHLRRDHPAPLPGGVHGSQHGDPTGVQDPPAPGGGLQGGYEHLRVHREGERRRNFRHPHPAGGRPHPAGRLRRRGLREPQPSGGGDRESS